MGDFAGGALSETLRGSTRGKSKIKNMSVYGLGLDGLAHAGLGLDSLAHAGQRLKSLAYAGLAQSVLESNLKQSLAHAGLGLDSLGKYLQVKSCTCRTWTTQFCVS